MWLVLSDTLTPPQRPLLPWQETFCYTAGQLACGWDLPVESRRQEKGRQHVSLASGTASRSGG